MCSLNGLQSGVAAQNGSAQYKKRAQPVQLPPDYNADEYVSQRYAKRSGNKHRVSDAHSNVKSLSSTEAKLQYIRNWEALPEHGLHYFIVKFRNGKNKPELIAVTHNRLMKVNSDSGEATKTWRFSAMKKWHVNWEIRHIKIQFDNEDVEFKPLSADCKVIHEFIGGYIFLSMRSKDQNQTLDEEGFQDGANQHPDQLVVENRIC